MNPFTARHLNKLQGAILKADLMLLNKRLRKLSPEQLNAPLFAAPNGSVSAAELAIIQQQPQVLVQLLRAGADPNQPGSQQRPLLYLALQQPRQSLALVTALLQNGCQADAVVDSQDLPRTALLACFEYCTDSSLMLPISRLIEHGATLNKAGLNGCTPLQKALQAEQLSLIQLMIHSGAELPGEIPAHWCSAATADYARRCAEDLRIRKLMQA